MFVVADQTAALALTAWGVLTTALALPIDSPTKPRGEALGALGAVSVTLASFRFAAPVATR